MFDNFPWCWISNIRLLTRAPLSPAPIPSVVAASRGYKILIFARDQKKTNGCAAPLS